MKKALAPRWGIVWIIGFALCSANAIFGWDRLELIKPTFIGTNFYAAVLPYPTNEWIRVEVSSDLVHWQEFVNVWTTTQSILVSQEGGKGVGQRFFRARTPATAPPEAQARWEKSGCRNYRYDFQFVAPDARNILRFYGGTLTVRNGAKTVNAIDPITDEALPDLDPAMIPDIDEVFGVIEARSAPGFSTRLMVTYDRELGYPVSVRDIYNDWIYIISNFEVL